ncbi:MAG: type II toxin-antitoxin system RelE/ParE family toxin [Pasteurella sp.]|nr:type II toxin-antitoxin system RelE/ParE family toxin [Pasteurella sp.]
MMKFDYHVVWTATAKKQLFEQAEWILNNSKNIKTTLNFYQKITKEVDKLSYLADVYRYKERKYLVILKKYKVKFLISNNNVYIVEFKSTRQQ